MFKYCPHCKSAEITFNGINGYQCKKCGWVYYHNVAAAVMAILVMDKKILFEIRANEPGKGKLDLPGGLIDPGENAEQALKREIKEELNLTISKFKYIGTAINEYPYNDIIYNTCDIIYYSDLPEIPNTYNSSEVKGVVLKSINKLREEEIASKSIVEALKIYNNMSNLDEPESIKSLRRQFPFNVPAKGGAGAKKLST